MTPLQAARWRYKCATRAWYDAYKANSKCAECGCSDPDKLQFHHKNPKSKEVNIARMVAESHSVASILREIKKCVILCEVCHAKAHGLTDPIELRIPRTAEGAKSDA
jgi:5-methylcytosine-specific restriction endonuclease McrA